MTLPMLFAFDLETTGLPADADIVVPVQVAGVILDPNLPGWPELESISLFVIPPYDAYRNPVAMAMHRAHGRDEQWLFRNGLAAYTAYSQLEQTLKPYGEVVLAGHNIGPFDVPLLARDMKRWGYNLTDKDCPRLADHHIIDTATMAYERYGPFGTNELQSVSLRHLAPFLGVAYNKADAHDGLYDARVAADCLRRMMNV